MNNLEGKNLHYWTDKTFFDAKSKPSETFDICEIKLVVSLKIVTDL
jgi:hypothetical protein